MTWRGPSCHIAFAYLGINLICERQAESFSSCRYALADELQTRDYQGRSIILRSATHLARRRKGAVIGTERRAATVTSSSFIDRRPGMVLPAGQSLLSGICSAHFRTGPFLSRWDLRYRHRRGSVCATFYFYPTTCDPKGTEAAQLLPKRQRYCLYKYPHPSQTDIEDSFE